MEAYFGHDFSGVRVHTDDRAAEAAHAIDSDAFTLGNQVVFAAGRWAPETAAGSRLLAHELTHVIQQRSALAPVTGRLEVSRRGDTAERAADSVAAGFGGPEPPQAEPVPHLRVARQDAAPGDRPLAPILSPDDPRIRKILEQVAEPRGEAIDPACQAPVAQSPPWMPAPRQPSQIGLGEGTRRAPKLKEPYGPSGAKCRGACGADCPPTCRAIATYTEQYEVGGCGYFIEFPNPLLCGTHAGCREHDACFDAAVANGETDLEGPRHVECNKQAFSRHPIDALSWARGGGPYDAWWYFVDDPVVRKSWRLKKPTETPPPSSP